jgi:hydrogenase expression/formation protein HypE
MEEKITLAHGSGGVQTNELINSIFKKHFDNPYLTADDAAVLDVTQLHNSSDVYDSGLKLTDKVAMSTDGFIVSPYEFAGGNIGKLSICGTVNDIACMGAIPEYLTCAMVIEEGFPVAKLDEIAGAMAKTAKEAGVNIVAGDTKVAGKGQVDKIFITTTGFGHIIEGADTSGAYAKPGDKILDTHLGSGSSRIAAYDAGLNFVGYEIDKAYFDKQEKRFAEHSAQLNLFLGG